MRKGPGRARDGHGAQLLTRALRSKRDRLKGNDGTPVAGARPLGSGGDRHAVRGCLRRPVDGLGSEQLGRAVRRCVTNGRGIDDADADEYHPGGNADRHPAIRTR